MPRSDRRAALLLCGIALTACDVATAPTTATAPGRPSLDAIAEFDLPSYLSTMGVPLLQPQAGEQGVTAGGTVDNPGFPAGIGSTFNLGVSAVRHTDGSFTGQFEYVTHVNGTTFEPGTIYTHGTVLCFSLVGTDAVLGGVITQSNFDPVGTQVAFHLTDVGEGANSPPDLASGLAVGAPALVACASHSGPPQQFPLSGQVQVHP